MSTNDSSRLTPYEQNTVRIMHMMLHAAQIELQASEMKVQTLLSDLTSYLANLADKRGLDKTKWMLDKSMDKFVPMPTPAPAQEAQAPVIDGPKPGPVLVPPATPEALEESLAEIREELAAVAAEPVTR